MTLRFLIQLVAQRSRSILKTEYFKSSLGVKDEFVRPCARAHLMSGVIGGEIHVAELPGVGIVGVAMWFRPGQKMLSTCVPCIPLSKSKCL